MRVAHANNSQLQEPTTKTVHANSVLLILTSTFVQIPGELPLEEVVVGEEVAEMDRLALFAASTATAPRAIARAMAIASEQWRIAIQREEKRGLFIILALQHKDRCICFIYMINSYDKKMCLL